MSAFSFWSWLMWFCWGFFMCLGWKVGTALWNWLCRFYVGVVAAYHRELSR